MLFFSVMLCPTDFSETIKQIIPDLNCLGQVFCQRNIKVTNTSYDREGGILTAQQYYTEFKLYSKQIQPTWCDSAFTFLSAP